MNYKKSTAFSGKRAVLIAAVWSFGVVPATALPAGATTVQPARSSEELCHKPFFEELKEVLELLEREKIFDPADPQTRSRVLDAVLKSVGANLAAVDGTESSQERPLDSGTVNGKVLEQSFAFLRPEIHSSTAGALREWLAEAFPESKPLGLIVDLRNANRGSTETIEAIVEEIAAAPPALVVLVGARTAGPGEQLTRALKQRANAFVVGKATAGRAFPYRTVATETGLELSLPDLRGTHLGGDELHTPIQPDVEVTGSVDPDAPFHRDPDVRRALDLLITIQAFSAKHF